MAYERERTAGLEAVRKACGLCETIRADMVTQDTIVKADHSPVTIADFSVQAMIRLALNETFARVPMVGEEDSGDLRAASNADLLSRITDYVRTVLPGITTTDVISALDAAGDPGGATGRHWILDPIDGTKGFLRGEQYAVALALMEEGQIMFGALGCPRYHLLENSVSENRIPTDSQSNSVGCVFEAVKGQGTRQSMLDAPISNIAIHVSPNSEPAQAVVCESVESGHSSHGFTAQVVALLGITTQPLRMDSQCKYAAVACGDASLYLRLPTQAGYVEKIWDHAAGWLAVKEAGGEVTDLQGQPLDFSQGRTLSHNRGIVASNGKIHAQVLTAVAQALQSQQH